jgi:hypothetical protein
MDSDRPSSSFIGLTCISTTGLCTAQLSMTDGGDSRRARDPVSSLKLLLTSSVCNSVFS